MPAFLPLSLCFRRCHLLDLPASRVLSPLSKCVFRKSGGGEGRCRGGTSTSRSRVRRIKREVLDDSIWFLTWFTSSLPVTLDFHLKNLLNFEAEEVTISTAVAYSLDTLSSKFYPVYNNRKPFDLLVFFDSLTVYSASTFRCSTLNYYIEIPDVTIFSHYNP